MTASRTILMVPLVALAWPTVGPVSAQSFLDRLEQRLQQIVPTTPEGEQQLPPDVGRPGYLGLVGDEAIGGGVRIESLRPGGPAERAGLRVGDRILEVNGRPVSNLNDMARGLERQWVRSRVRFLIERDGEAQQRQVVLGERPGQRETPIADQAAAEGPSLLPAERPRPAGDLFLPPERPVIGATFAEVTTAQQRRYGLTNSAGALVVDIEPDSPAASSRLLRGALITEINGQPIRHPRDVETLLDRGAPGDTWKIKYLVRQQSYDTELVLASRTANDVVPPDTPAPPSPGLADGDPAPLPRPQSPVADLPPRGPGAPPAPGIDLAQRLGRDGRRPLLGRIGQVLDDLAAGELAPEDLSPPPTSRAAQMPPSEGTPSGMSELVRLEAEVRRLTEEIERLKRRLELLEQRIVPREP
jgi:hypothetical protein